MGAGSAMVQVTTFAMLSSLYPDKVSLYIARIELALGVGMIVGPPLGTLLYNLGGFALPYWFYIGIFVVEFFVGMIALPGKRLSSKKKIRKEEKLIA